MVKDYQRLSLIKQRFVSVRVIDKKKQYLPSQNY